MFERVFQWALRHGPRLLFALAAAILMMSVAQGIDTISVSGQTRARTVFGRLWDGLSIDWTMALIFLSAGLSGAALPFFCTLVIQRIDLRLHNSGTVVATSFATAPSGLARHGARVLFALSLVYFLATALALIDLSRQVTTVGRAPLYLGAWIGPLWSGSLLLFASLALDRLDRWRATFRPTYSD